MSILTDLQGPADLRGLSEAQLAKLAAEIRATIVDTVARTGGHLGSSLGVVELSQGASAEDHRTYRRARQHPGDRHL